ncbi:RdgB/HAM1 family non-canonical purine NTP pyrophosphatase [Gayadomonas joobiniege]|uniref:RdgB/HAM1 family non-canonical purine NTP pyrophosphatase n=1 Tax=Gayadomonas joobiniege TaxID=1234606 RepID=UPI000362E4EC|nr:RdgB/HAM1 family non-canonical purine NTP pyrophosphatase [Gayadomonas joobiniege]
MTDKTQIVLATGNAGKVAELQQMLSDSPFDIVSQKSLNVPDAIEDGLSFIENAIKKARNACLHTGLPAIADDSGLEVDYLKGAPGIYSARYAGENASDQDNIDKLMAALSSAPADQRHARFQCVLVYLRHAEDPTPIVCHASWPGLIAEQQNGLNGFGYDPIFYLPEYQCTSAELEKSFKNQVSHRGQALKRLVAALNTLGGHS